jgi:PKD repeat protein
VRATHANGLAGERSNAIYWPGGLIGCPQTNDLAVGAITSPSGDAIVTCFSAEQPVSVVVRNEGIDVMEDATVSYQVNTGAVVTELLPALAPGQSLPVTFQTPLTLSGNGVIQLKVWTNSSVDMARFNDTIVLEIPVVTDAIGTPFTETFEATEGVPLGWVVGNPDGGITWVNTANLFPVIGKTGDPSNTMFMNHFLYNKEGELDHLYMVPIDLSGYTYPQLSFDVAHRRYNNSYSEGLRVEIFPGCNLNDPPVVLYDKIDPALATVINGTGFYVPGAETDWRRDSVDLTPYVGQKAVVRFVSVNDYGNNTYLDNIGVASFEPPVPPIAAITASDDTICRQDTAYFSANILSANTGYSWNFGAQAFPTSASGAGPHQVYYPSSGTKNIRLIASTPLGFDTAFHVLTVLPFPLVNFAYASSNLTVTFTNATTNADTYLWDFGDGTTSTEANPVHTYALAGTYNVVLSATNACRTNTKTATVTLTTSGVQEQLDHLSAQVLPNPAAGDFVLYLEGTYQGALEWRLFDAQGRLIRSQSTTLVPGATSLPIPAKTLPAGVYQLTLRTAEGSMQRRIVRL